MAIRITNGMLVTNFLTDLNNSMNQYDKYYQQVVTGKKVTRISDDPVRLVTAMNSRKMVRSYTQYDENVSTARTWIDQTETSLRDVEEAIKSIYELTVQAASDTNGDVERAAIGKTVKEFVDHIQQSLNATINNKHIFSGYSGTKIPFERGADGGMTYNGINLNNAVITDQNVVDEMSQNFELELGVSIKMEVTFTGIEITGVGDTNMFKILDDLVTDLVNGEPNEVLDDYLTKLEELRAGVMEKVTTIGSRSKRLDMLESRYSQDIINYDETRGRIEDADEAEAIMKYSLAEAVYNKALAAGAQIIMPTLLDYVK